MENIYQVEANYIESNLTKNKIQCSGTIEEGSKDENIVDEGRYSHRYLDCTDSEGEVDCSVTNEEKDKFKINNDIISAL